MKNFICIVFCHLTILAFGQESVTNNKLIRGFVFDNSYFSSIPLPVAEADIEVIGTERKTKTDNDGKFEIKVKEGEELAVLLMFSKTQKIIITDKNCYKINLNTTLIDYPMFFESKRARRVNARYYRKIVKKLIKKMETGFYDCLD